MVKLAVFFTVIVACLLVDKVNSSSNFNIQTFLQGLQQQLKSEQRQQRQKVYYIKDAGSGYYGPLQHSNVEKIYSLPKTEKEHRTGHKDTQNRHQDDDQPQRLHLKGYKLSPNDLLGLDNLQQDRSLADSDDKEDDDDAQNEYSKVYVVLNSEAIRKSKNKDKLNALLSSLLSAPPDRQSNRHVIKQKRPRDSSDWFDHRYDDKGDRYPKKRGRYQEKRYRDTRDKYQKKRNRNKNQHPRYEQRYQDRYDGNYRDDRDQDDLSDSYFSDEEWFSQHEYDYRNRKRDRRYKQISRKMMASGEQYGKEVDMDPRPPPRQRESRDKPRSRNRDRGGSMGGGRTAIPYIRHHGDIYEKSDNFK